MRVLVVDDEVRLTRSLRAGLEAEGIAVDVAHDGTDGLWLARENAYDAMVLDLMLPGINGYRVCQTLREEENWTPILMLTAKDADDEDGDHEGRDDDGDRDVDERALSAEERAAAEKAALGEVGGTVTDAEASDDPGEAYEVEVVTADGAEWTVELDADFDVLDARADD